MYIFGGYNGDINLSPDLYRFDFNTKKWSIEPSIGTVPCGRSRARMMVHHNTLSVFGGWDRKNHFQHWYDYNLDTHVWKEIELDTPGCGIGQHSAVVYNNAAYVFGGFHKSLGGSSDLLWGYFLGK